MSGCCARLPLGAAFLVSCSDGGGGPVVNQLPKPGDLESLLWAVQHNLIIANADWEDFAGAVDGEGVFRGIHR